MMLLSSFKPPEDLTSSTPTLAFTPTLEHYEALFSGGNNIGPYIRNSLVAAGISTIIAVVLGCLAGYGLARSRFRGKDHVAFWIIPLVLPGIATTAILCLVFSWNDYAFAVTFSGPDSQTLPIAASQLVTQTSIDWGQLTAIGTIVVAPMILVGLIVRKWLVTGLTLGAVTGE
jgi:ABC-type glycerol-3-phosphate transport system permease component